MADDPYQTLGVSKDASDDDIRKAFRRLAKESHPDLFPGNSGAAERFKKISAAYDLLGDADKRRLFDAGAIDATGEPRRGPAPGRGGPFRSRQANGDDFGFGDVFSDIFSTVGSGARPDARPAGMRGQDVRYTLEVDFLEAVLGVKKRVTLPDGGVLDLNVPEGVGDAQVLRLKGKGAAGFNGAEAGDALVEIRVKPHAHFKRNGDDLLIELPITLDEAVLGAKVEAPTASGRVQLTIPKGTSSGRVFRLKGKGVRNPSSGQYGDELVTVRIVLPEQIDDGLAYFLSEWRQKNKYDPGRPG